MKKTVRLGALLLIAGIAIWLVQIFFDYRANKPPLIIPLPTAKNAVLNRSLNINVTGTYFIYASFKPVGSLSKVDPIEFLNTNQNPSLPCKIHITIYRESTPFIEEDIMSLKGAFVSKERLGYRLTAVQLAEPGAYTITINNQEDLSYLDSTEPLLEVQINSAITIEKALTNSIITLIGIIIGLSGLLILITALVRQKFRSAFNKTLQLKNPSRSSNEFS